MYDKGLERIAAKIVSGRPGWMRTAGKIEFVKDTGPLRRDIRVNGFEWSPDAHRDLAKILWAAQRAHSYAMAAYRLFSKMPSSQFSPDGLLGGRGYIQSVKDMRNGLSAAVETLSAFTDTLHDEVNASHWAGSSEEVDDLIEGAENVKRNPEAFVESEYREESGDDGFNEPIRNPDPDDYNPHVENEESEDGGSEDEEHGQHQVASYPDTIVVKDKNRVLGEEKDDAPDKPGSRLPSGTGEQGQGKTAPEMVMHTTTPPSGNYAASIKRIVMRHEARMASSRFATSSLPTETLPGPRIDHIGPAEGNEAGHFSDEDVWPSDDLAGEGISSGTNMSKPLMEEWTADGVTGYDNPTDGDSSVLRIAARLVAETYSWLPGSSNEKNLDYYAPGLTESDINWMREHAAPEPPPGAFPKSERHDTKSLWEAKF